MFRNNPQHSGALVPVVNAAITTMLYMPKSSSKCLREAQQQLLGAVQAAAFRVKAANMG
jgi:hypothetical protein